MSPQIKKQVERFQLERFKALYPYFPEGRIEETEEPDFVVHAPESRIGIEVTDLYWENSPGQQHLQAKEALRAQIVEMTQRKYEAHNLQFLNVSIHFNSCYTLRKSELDRISTKLASLLTKNAPALGETYTEGYDFVNREYFPEEINIVRAKNLPNQPKSFFSSPSAEFIPKLTQNDIERAIKPKESKVKKYKEKAQEVWLLINCDSSGQLSTFFDFNNDDALQLRQESNFDKIFLLRHLPPTVHHIK